MSAENNAIRASFLVELRTPEARFAVFDFVVIMSSLLQFLCPQALRIHTFCAVNAQTWLNDYGYCTI